MYSLTAKCWTAAEQQIQGDAHLSGIEMRRWDMMVCRQITKAKLLIENRSGMKVSPLLKEQVNDGIAAIFMIEEHKEGPVHEPCSLLKLD